MKTVWLHSLNHQEKPAAIKKHHELDKPTLACLLPRRMFFFLFSLSKIRFLLFWLHHFSREKYRSKSHWRSQKSTTTARSWFDSRPHALGWRSNVLEMLTGRLLTAGLAYILKLAVLSCFAAVQSSAVNFIHGYQPRQDMEERKPPRRLLCSESFIAFHRRLQSIFSDLSQTSIPLALLNLQYTSLKVIMPPSSLKCQHTLVIRFC